MQDCSTPMALCSNVSFIAIERACSILCICFAIQPDGMKVEAWSEHLRTIWNIWTLFRKQKLIFRQEVGLILLNELTQFCDSGKQTTCDQSLIYSCISLLLLLIVNYFYFWLWTVFTNILLRFSWNSSIKKGILNTLGGALECLDNEGSLQLWCVSQHIVSYTKRVHE